MLVDLFMYLALLVVVSYSILILLTLLLYNFHFSFRKRSNEIEQQLVQICKILSFTATSFFAENNILKTTFVIGSSIT